MSSIRDVRRPLTARSVIASTLLGVDPPRLPALALVRSGELFGLREGATRTALSRMAAAGEVVAENGTYALSGRLLERHSRQQAAREPAPDHDWDGTWELAIVLPDRRPADARSALRDAARRLGLAEVREGVWARPANLDPHRAPAARAVVEAQCARLREARVDDPTAFLDPFDLPGWAETARSLVDEMRADQPALDARDLGAIARTFVTDAAVVRHLLADPRLPAELQPPTWPGDELRTTFDRFDAAFSATWAHWHRSFRRDDRFG